MKKVLVAYTNYDYLKYVKALVRGARDVGKWDDDIVIIIPLEDKVKVQETMETSGLGGLDIKLFYAKPFTKDFYIHYYKLFVFDDYFKQWDWIFHVDLDVIFNEKLDLKLTDRNINTLYAKDDGLSLYQQFDMIPDDDDSNISFLILVCLIFCNKLKVFTMFCSNESSGLLYPVLTSGSAAK